VLFIYLYNINPIKFELKLIRLTRSLKTRFGLLSLIKFITYLFQMKNKIRLDFKFQISQFNLLNQNMINNYC